MLDEDLSLLQRAARPKNVSYVLSEQETEEAETNEADLNLSYIWRHLHRSSKMRRHGLALQSPTRG